MTAKMKRRQRSATPAHRESLSRSPSILSSGRQHTEGGEATSASTALGR